MAKLPSFQFYPGDWQKDPDLRRCSHAAKGVWIDMLCLMFEADERGVLATNGVAWSDEEIACAVGGDAATTIGAIQELTFKGVAKRRSNGALYSKRMVADENKRRMCSEAGKRGGGNPKLRENTPTFKGVPKGGVKGDVKGGSKQNPNPSSSSSSSDNITPSNTRTREDGFSLEEVLEAAKLPDVAVSEAEARKFFDHYNGEWTYGNGKPITCLATALRRWKGKQEQFQQKGRNHGNENNFTGRPNRNAGTYNDNDEPAIF